MERADQSNVPIEVQHLPVAPNICQQELREIWQDIEGRASIAHVIMLPGAESDLHFHQQMTELYYILEGTGVLVIGRERFSVKGGTVMEIKPLIPHQLFNAKDATLTHLVLATPSFDPSDVYLVKE